MKKLVVLLMVSLLASSAFAVVDEDPDMLGVYFDTNANINCTTAGPSVPFNMYFMITNVSAANVFGVEFSYDLVGGAGLYFRLSEILPGGALNVGDSSLPGSGDYIVGFSSPLAGSGASVTVATWSVLLLAPTAVDVFLGPSNPESIADGLPAMEIGGTIAPLGLSTGGPEIAVATINGGNCPVPNEELSFGSVKSLFR